MGHGSAQQQHGSVMSPRSRRPIGLLIIHQCYSPWAALGELVEAATRGRRPEYATKPFQQLTEITTASGTEWALGIQARSRALLSQGKPAAHAYRETIH